MNITQALGLYLIVGGLILLVLARNFHLNKDPANDDKDFPPSA